MIVSQPAAVIYKKQLKQMQFRPSNKKSLPHCAEEKFQNFSKGNETE